MGKTIAIFNQKGGVGKTTSCINFAACLGAKGKKTLLVDVDPQGNSTSGVGVEKTDLEYSTYDILINKVPARGIMIETQFKNLSVLPANMNLAGAELELAELEDRYFALKKAIAPLTVDFDYIIDSKLGETNKNLSYVFEEINHIPHQDKVVVLFDEIDAIALDRISSNDVREMGRVTSTMLR